MSNKKTLLTLHKTMVLLGIVQFIVYRLLIRDLPEPGVFAWRIVLLLSLLITYCSLFVYYAQRKWLVIHSIKKRFIPLIALFIWVILLITHLSRPTLLYHTSERFEDLPCAFYPDMRLNMATFAQAHHHAMIALVTFDEHLSTQSYRPLFTRNSMQSDMHTYRISIVETPFYPSPKYINEVVILQASKHAPHLCQALTQDMHISTDRVYLVIIYIVYLPESRPLHQNKIMSLVEVDGYDASLAYEDQDETVLAKIETLLTPYE